MSSVISMTVVVMEREKEPMAKRGRPKKYPDTRTM
jgi:hypothetical protein